MLPSAEVLGLLVVILISTTLSLTKAQCTSTPSWGYNLANGPNTGCWNVGVCQSGGQRQSPIDIPNYRDLKREENWLPFQWINYHETAEEWEMINTGHTASIKVTTEDCKGFPRVFQGGLQDTFQLNEIHFRWGSWHDKGAEHTINGKRYSAEIQLLHVNEKCGREIPEALQLCPNGTDTFGILSVFIDVGDNHNDQFEPIIQALKNVKHEEEVTEIQPIKPIDLLPHEKNKFFRYYGSFTTPTLDIADKIEDSIGCAESVVWTVFKEPLKISYHQLKRFWGLRTTTAGLENEHLIDTFRPSQNLNGREVVYADLKLECKHENNWRYDHDCDIKYKELQKSMSFVESSHACIGNNYGSTPLVGLMPVSKLRCLRNTFDYNSEMSRNQEKDICGRFFRVNAIKEHGLWTEFGNAGIEINFHHFPSFDPEYGNSGDTLIWDALENRLIIVDADEKHTPLCFKEYEKDCQSCVGHNVRHECGDAGDCMDNVCYCDSEFRGKACQLGPIPDKDVIQISNGTERWNTKQTSGSLSCIPNSYAEINPMAKTEMICDFVFGKGLCCGGHDPSNLTVPNTDICGLFDCQEQTWTNIHDFPISQLLYEAATVLRRHGKDYGWLVSGGEYQSGSSPSSIPKKGLYMMTDHFRWEDMNAVMPTPRSGHCMVQINDLEVAFIGGSELFSSLTYYDTIDIYNFEENTWRVGPQLQEAIQLPACGMVRDSIFLDDKVIIGCGSNTANLQIWSLENDEIYLSDFTCPTIDISTPTNAKFKSLDDQTLILTNTFNGESHTFTAEYGFESVFTGMLHYGGDTFVANSGYVECLEY